MKKRANICVEAIFTVTVTILLLSILQWLTKSLILKELFTGEQMVFIILGVFSSLLLWRFLIKQIPHLSERIGARQTGVKIKTTTIQPQLYTDAESQARVLNSLGELSQVDQPGLKRQVNELGENIQQEEPSTTREMENEKKTKNEKEEAASKVQAGIQFELPKDFTIESSQKSKPFEEVYGLDFTEEELQELRELVKRIRELKRRILTYEHNL